ncbi:polysaccharide export outer membrane protein [Herbaspirillum sp. Sphag1AN]|uniref:SLBB domain-containing protein n=1 Tax=unclassified Herbaspirillum TaxID=2624150 RepID=UPI00160C345B|nr:MULTISPECIES: SLBB domain-containing protein [unclassified Herbaspirillum]MBB3211087.1 polysaccharide export outer membrane protein [Herbaspirillum sp. Sphag1AN]MBB3244716.1 polysaccharide export outer membrane protein [Herbaspirillum sp. Sphag64]
MRRITSFLLSLAVVLAVLSYPVQAQVPTDPTQNLNLMTAPADTLSTPGLPSSVVTDTRVGNGDVIRVTVFGQPDLSAEVGVNDKGILTLPLIGGIDVKGLTTSEIAERVTQALRQGQYVIKPQVSVDVVQLRSQMVSVLGEVTRPGRYVIPGHLSVLELLATAGGLTEQADQTVTLMRRKTDGDAGQTSDKISDVRIPILLGDNTNQPQTPLDVELRAGDVVYVNRKKLFYIHGEVNKPGSYPMEKDMNVMRAIAIGGGMTQRASQRRIFINRAVPEQGIQEIKAKLTDPVLPGDVVYINESLF